MQFTIIKVQITDFTKRINKYNMDKSQFLIRKAVIDDIDQIFDLYKVVSKTIGGLARTENEITVEYVKNFVEKSFHKGIQFVVSDKLNNEKLIAEIHCYKLEQTVFGHILSELTIVVDPAYQGKGLGKMLCYILFRKTERIFCALN